jgi:hypothetical protein
MVDTGGGQVGRRMGGILTAQKWREKVEGSG